MSLKTQVISFDRPREKMEKYGPEKLSDAELLAILLRTGTKDLNVLKLSQKILQKFAKEDISKINVENLKSIKGLGTAKACEIVACFELGKRILKDKKPLFFYLQKMCGKGWRTSEEVKKNILSFFI